MPAAPEPILCYVTDRLGFAARAGPARRNLGVGGLEGRDATSDIRPEKRHTEPLRAVQELIHKAAAAGVDWIQIREKDLEARLLLELASFAVTETRATAVRVLVNDRLDVAIAAATAGVHLGESSLPVEIVAKWRRSVRGNDFMIGVSCHSLDSARAAVRAGANYIIFGPVFATPSKVVFGPPQGIEQLREVCASVEIPVLAIGGVSLETAHSCLEAGAAGIAAIRLFQDAENMEEIVARLKAR